MVECVAVGGIAAAYISADRGWITREEADEIRQTMQDFGEPVTVRGTFDGRCDCCEPS